MTDKNSEKYYEQLRYVGESISETKARLEKKRQKRLARLNKK